jgi:hypothetical protein
VLFPVRIDDAVMDTTLTGWANGQRASVAERPVALPP